MVVLSAGETSVQNQHESLIFKKNTDLFAPSIFGTNVDLDVDL